MSRTTGNQTHANLYGNANLFYIRAPEWVETRTNGLKKIKANPYPSNRALITQWELLCLIDGSGVPSWALRPPSVF